MRALAVDFDDVELAFALIIESLERSSEKKSDPTELRAADAVHPEEIEGDAEGGIRVMGIVGAVAKLEFNHMKESSLPGGTGHGNNSRAPTPEGEVRKKTEVARRYEVKPLFEPHHWCHSFIITYTASFGVFWDFWYDSCVSRALDIDKIDLV